MPTPSLPHSVPNIEVLRVVDLGDGRSVATIRCGPWQLGSIFILEGRVSWPRTARGYPIVECIDDELRQRVEAAILSRVAP
jgi:hypothetical protein